MARGGLLVRVFDRRYPGEAAGFVFVDASHPEQDRRFPAELRHLIEEKKSEADRRWLFRMIAPYRIFAPEGTTPRTAYWWRSFPDGVPLTMPGVSAEGNAALRHTWVKLHEELAGLSTNSDHRVVEAAGHCVHEDRPEAVVTAVRDVVTAVRERGPVRRVTAATGQAAKSWTHRQSIDHHPSRPSSTALRLQSL